MAKHFYKFGPYCLDSEERVLRRDDTPVALPPKDLETLLVLVERAGHIVDKEELLEKVWPGVFIEEGNLSRRIFNLRQVLGDGTDGQKYIETIPRRGYRFVAELQEDEAADAVPLAASLEQKQAAPRPNRTRLLWSLAIAILLLVIGGLASQRFFIAGHASSQKVMLAVLPFANMSGDANNEYFADGFTEEMITQLGQVQPTRLGVIARTSAMRYKSTHLSAAQICQELGVNYLLEGSVRHAGDRVRITAQLIQASDQTHLWAESYDAPMTDVLHLQQEIAGRITNSLKLELLPTHNGPSTDAHRDPEAYRKYLLALNESRKGTREGLEKSIQYLGEALAAEPKEARYYEALAQVYGNSVPYFNSPLTAEPQVKLNVQKALELDPNLASAHAILGEVHLLFDWDWQAADKDFQRALALNPNSPEAHLGYANYFSTLGRHQEALAQIQQVYQFDPLALDSGVEALWVYYFSGHFDEAIVQARKTIQLEPQSGQAYDLLALPLAEKGRREEALQAAEEAIRVSDSPGVKVVAASALARVGEKEKARQIHEQGLKFAAEHNRYVCRFLAAATFVDLGENEKALESLEQGVREKST